jgi:hypothetical protein
MQDLINSHTPCREPPDSPCDPFPTTGCQDRGEMRIERTEYSEKGVRYNQIGGRVFVDAANCGSPCSE